MDKKEYIPGEFVRWYENYADGDVLKDAGYGVVINIRNFEEMQYKNYTVLRNKYGDTMIFGPHELEKYP